MSNIFPPFLVLRFGSFMKGVRNMRPNTDKKIAKKEKVKIYMINLLVDLGLTFSISFVQLKRLLVYVNMFVNGTDHICRCLLYTLANPCRSELAREPGKPKLRGKFFREQARSYGAL